VSAPNTDTAAATPTAHAVLCAAASPAAVAIAAAAAAFVPMLRRQRRAIRCMVPASPVVRATRCRLHVCCRRGRWVAGWAGRWVVGWVACWSGRGGGPYGRPMDDATFETKLRELAAVPDAELVEDIHAAAAAVFAAFEVWRAGPGWSSDSLGVRLAQVVTDVRAAIAALPAGAGVTATVNAVRPLLGAYWPDRPAAAAATAAAVEQLRAAALHRPSGVAQARTMLDTRDGR
jgi:hypothetical protein